MVVFWKTRMRASRRWVPIAAAAHHACSFGGCRDRCASSKVAVHHARSSGSRCELARVFQSGRTPRALLRKSPRAADSGPFC